MSKCSIQWKRSTLCRVEAEIFSYSYKSLISPIRSTKIVLIICQLQGYFLLWFNSGKIRGGEHIASQWLTYFLWMKKHCFVVHVWNDCGLISLVSMELKSWNTDINETCSNAVPQLLQDSNYLSEYILIFRMLCVAQCIYPAVNITFAVLDTHLPGKEYCCPFQTPFHFISLILFTMSRHFWRACCSLFVLNGI
jgi:hypothetical protein